MNPKNNLTGELCCCQRAERGASAIEYSMLLGILAVAWLAFLPPMSQELKCKFVRASTELTGGGTEINTGFGEAEGCEAPLTVVEEPFDPLD